MSAFNDYHTVEVEIERSEDDVLCGELTVHVSGEKWKDFKGFCGSAPAYQDEVEWELDSIEWNGQEVSREELAVILGPDEASQWIDLAVERALELV